LNVIYSMFLVGLKLNSIKLYEFLWKCFVRGVAMAEFEEFWVRFAGSVLCYREEEIQLRHIEATIFHGAFQTFALLYGGMCVCGYCPYFGCCS
jgi:hypothetical protein